MVLVEKKMNKNDIENKSWTYELDDRDEKERAARAFFKLPSTLNNAFHFNRYGGKIIKTSITFPLENSLKRSKQIKDIQKNCFEINRGTLLFLLERFQCPIYVFCNEQYYLIDEKDSIPPEVDYFLLTRVGEQDCYDLKFVKESLKMDNITFERAKELHKSQYQWRSNGVEKDVLFLIDDYFVDTNKRDVSNIALALMSPLMLCDLFLFFAGIFASEQKLIIAFAILFFFLIIIYPILFAVVKKRIDGSKCQMYVRYGTLYYKTKKINEMIVLSPSVELVFSYYEKPFKRKLFISIREDGKTLYNHLLTIIKNNDKTLFELEDNLEIALKGTGTKYDVDLTLFYERRNKK